MKANQKHIFATAYLLLLVAFTGCTTKITIRANADKSARMEYSMDLGESLASTIKSLAASMGAGEIEGSVFSAPQIEGALTQGDFADVSVSTPSSYELQVAGTIPAPEKQSSVLKEGDLKIANFVTCTASSLTVILSPETIGRIVESLPEDIRTVTDMLMAPVFTGDIMSTAEYRELIATVYGEELAKEMDGSVLQVTLEAPNGKSIKKASLSETERSRTMGGKAVFTIPLVEFFTLSSPKTFSITW